MGVVELELGSCEVGEFRAVAGERESGVQRVRRIVVAVVPCPDVR